MRFYSLVMKLAADNYLEYHIELKWHKVILHAFSSRNHYVVIIIAKLKAM